MVIENNFYIDYYNLNFNFVNYFVICFDNCRLICDSLICYMSYFLSDCSGNFDFDCSNNFCFDYLNSFYFCYMIDYWNNFYFLGLIGNWI